MTASTPLFQTAKTCLDICNAAEKAAATHAGCEALQALTLPPPGTSAPPDPITIPGHPPRPQRVAPREVPRRGLGTPAGRAALVHAIAHIEFNAINLAWDAIYRFREMPADYYRDWVRIAGDEARHFTLLSERLAQLGYSYGDFNAHNGLWEMAEKTADSCLARMALVPRVLEARGLDVTPGMIQRLRSAGDVATADILAIILREEISHVAAGTRWFRYCCQHQGRDPHTTFTELLNTYLGGKPRGPFNLDARRAAGFAPAELEYLTQG